jgi:hypothetical protein
MAVRRGEPFGVFTGGWFDKFTGKFRGALDVFTGGWWETIGPDIELSATAQVIVYEAGVTSSEISELFFTSAQSMVFESSTFNLEIDESIDYIDYPALPNDYLTKCGPAYDSEREMFSVLQTEVYNMFGVPCFFYPVSYDKQYDRIWGEDNNRSVSAYWPDVNAYFNLPKEEKIWSKLGIEGMENFPLYVSKTHFDCVTSGYIPLMGDLIQSEYNSKLYEIVEIKEEYGMYMLSKQYTWEIIVKPFKDERVKVLGEVSASPLSAFADRPSGSDIFDITNEIDVEKENVIYKPKPSEKPNADPFGNW